MVTFKNRMIYRPKKALFGPCTPNRAFFGLYIKYCAKSSLNPDTVFSDMKENVFGDILKFFRILIFVILTDLERKCLVFKTVRISFRKQCMRPGEPQVGQNFGFFGRHVPKSTLFHPQAPQWGSRPRTADFDRGGSRSQTWACGGVGHIACKGPEYV